MDAKQQFGEEQILGFLEEADQRLPVKEQCRRHGFSEASLYNGRISVSEPSASLTYSAPKLCHLVQKEQQVLDSERARRFGITLAAVRSEAAQTSRMKAPQGGVKQ